MAFKIPKLLSANIDITGTNATWTDSSDLSGVAFRWDATIAVDTQLHSTPGTNTYDGTDVEVGDFIASTNRGECLEIQSIVSQNAGEVICVLEDRERLNSYADSGQVGDGSVPDGRGIIFEAKEGIPILFPLPSTFPAELNPAFVDQIINRFKYRREDKTFLIQQISHGFAVGDVLTISSAGTYSKVDASSTYDNIIGFVTEVDHPSDQFFRFQPQSTDIVKLALTGDIGSVHYLDPTTPGGVTPTAPTTSDPIPAFIKFSSNKVLPIIGGASVTSSSGGGGGAGTWVVNTYSDLSSLSPSEGDLAYVKNTDVDNEFTMYVYISSAWIMFSHNDVEHTDARSISYSFAGNTATGATIATVGNNARIIDVVFDVTVAFGSGADVTIGTTGDVDLIVEQPEVDLSEVGKYHIVSGHKFASATETDIKVTFTNGGVPTGNATVVMSYV